MTIEQKHLFRLSIKELSKEEYSQLCSQVTENIAIQFAEWIRIKVRPLAPNQSEWTLEDGSKKTIRTEELFKLFKTQNQL